MNIGEKSWNWIKKGIPLKLEIGLREIQNDHVFMIRRDTREEMNIKYDKLFNEIPIILDDIQISMFKKANNFCNKYSAKIDNYDEFRKFFSEKRTENPEVSGGFAWSHFCGDLEWEKKINDELGVSIRLLPLNKALNETNKCIFSGKKSIGRVLFAKSY